MSVRSCLGVFGLGVGIGAGAMCLYDPAQGARRRALLRDKAESRLREAADGERRVVRDLRNRIHGTVLDLDGRIRALARGDLDRVFLVRPGGHGGRWSPTGRLLAGGAGGALFVYGRARRGIFGAILSLAGLGLAIRGASGLPLRRLLGHADGSGLIHIDKSLHINAPVEQVFEQFRRYENFPVFMSHVREVSEIGPRRSRWVIDGPAGAPVEWVAELTDERHADLLAWRTDPGSIVEHTGRLRFLPQPGDTTRVDVHLSYTPPAGVVGYAVAELLGADPKRLIDEDLLRMKTFIETGTPPHDAARRKAGAESRGEARPSP